MRIEGSPNRNPSEIRFSKNDLGSVSEGYMLYSEAGTIPSSYLRTETMPKGYGSVPESYMYPKAGAMPSGYLWTKTMSNDYGLCLKIICYILK
jgi:hypothetical protein